MRRFTIYKLLFCCQFILLSILSVQAQTSHRRIHVTVKPLKNETVYLVSSYGKQSISIVDSVLLDDNSSGTFKGLPVTQGIYYLFSKPSKIWAEFLMDSLQQFEITVDTLKLENTRVVGSKENDLMRAYSATLYNFNAKNDSLKSLLIRSTGKKDSLAIIEQIKNYNEKLIFYKDSIAKIHSGTLFSFLLTAMRLPTLPKYASSLITRKDTLIALRFMKDHFWDDVYFHDDRLIHTPFFESKLDDYFKYYVSPEVDSIWAEVEYILSFSKPGKEIFPYLLTRFTNKYMNPEYLGQDKIFVRLFEKFYLKGDSVYLNETSKKTVFERAYSLMANQIGDIAPKLILADTTSLKRIDLHTIDAKYTLIVFWDPTCGHCKTEIPHIDSIYKRSLKKYNLEILAVNIAYEHFKEWKSFITEHQLTSWRHGYQTEKMVMEEVRLKKPPTIRQLYDVIKTPTLYLLDEKKRILAKHLTIEQLESIIERREEIAANK